MKKFIILAVLVLAIVSCQQKKPDFEIVKINIKNYKADKIVIKNTLNKIVDSIQLTNHQTGIDTLHLKEGYYKFNAQREYTWIYLQPGMNLSVEIDNEDFDKTIKYSDKGSDINNYLANKMLLGIKLMPKTAYDYYGMLEEKPFLKLQDSIQSAYNDLLANSNLKNQKFVESEKIRHQLGKADLLCQYQMVRQYMTRNRDFKVSENYPDPMNGINIDDAKMMQLPSFSRIVESYIKFKSSNNKKGDYYTLQMKLIDSLLKNPELKEVLAYQNAKYNIMYSKNLEEFYSIADKLIINPEYKKEIKEKYDLIKQMVKGNSSPDFKAFDIKGKEYHLKDFAGKPLYIDLWATWCSPCRAEIPYLEKLKEKYKNAPITFLSLDVYDNKEKWVQMITRQKMGGWQLISTDKDMDFLKKYVVDGIPRFIFLNKDGKIIDANAMRPSNPGLVELIDKTLAEK